MALVVTGPLIALAAAVILVWALALLAGTLGTMPGEETETGEDEAW